MVPKLRRVRLDLAVRGVLSTAPNEQIVGTDLNRLVEKFRLNGVEFILLVDDVDEDIGLILEREASRRAAEGTPSPPLNPSPPAEIPWHLYPEDDEDL